jgi:N-acetylglutamate synthase-like GNAT family acetyltransferase
MGGAGKLSGLPVVVKGHELQLMAMAGASPELRIRSFVPGDGVHFRRLNEAWLTEYFHVEPRDEELLADPVAHFIRPGGDILLLDLAGQTIGCCALQNLGDGSFEIAKMAIDSAHRGRGYGRQLLEVVIDHARGLGARRLFIETSSKLPTAIALYRKLGFADIPPERVPPTDFARADVFLERWFL